MFQGKLFLVLALFLFAKVDGRYFSYGEQEEATQYTITIDGSGNLASLRNFWASTGNCPPDPHQEIDKWGLADDMIQNYKHAGAIPNRGLENVRTHWLLNLMTVKRVENEKLVFNWTNMDAYIKLLYDNGLHPGFEIQGNPSKFFSDLENRTELYMWKDMVTQIARRYIDKYGIDYVKKWEFETWNEPDHLTAYDEDLFLTPEAFMHYYDANSEGLKEASPLLRMGGPGGACREPEFTERCYGLLNHTVSGTNYFTGEKGVRIDYFSFHKKGLPPKNAEYIMNITFQTIKRLREIQPSTTSINYVNNEADPLSNWSKGLVWRADATYASMAVKLIAKHQYQINAKPGNDINWYLLSNDNGFLSFVPHMFTQRTIVARFQVNNTSPPHVQMIRKPILTVMGLLTLLGERQLPLQISDGQNLYTPDGEIGAMSTIHNPSASNERDSWQASAILYQSKDTENIQDQATVTVKFDNLQPPANSDLMMVRYSLDNDNGNPYKDWVNYGSPLTPDWNVFTIMRSHQDPIRTVGPTPITASLEPMTFTLPLPGISFIHICAKSAAEPGQPNAVQLHNVTSGQVMITWKDEAVQSRCISTYEVEYSATTADGPYTRINSQDTIFKIFVYAPKPANRAQYGKDSQVFGYYRIRAVDYWQRHSVYTTPVKY